MSSSLYLFLRQYRPTASAHSYERALPSFVLYIDFLLLQDRAVIDRPEYSAQIF